MQDAHQPSALVWVGIIALLCWRMYARIRRNVGRQKFRSARPWIQICLFPTLILLLAVRSHAQSFNLLSLFGGVLVGTGLGVYGLRLTRFEATAAGLYYTPNMHLGIGLSVLFIGRVVYRIAQTSLALPSLVSSSPDLSHGPFGVISPLTLAIFGTLAGYYVTYSIGLLRWSRRPVVDAAGPEVVGPV